MNVFSKSFQTGLIGTPVKHSLSPVMHNAAYEALGLSWRYGLFDCPGEEDAREGILQACKMSFVGLNVTMPYKTLAAKMASSLDDTARMIQAANVLSFRAGAIKGYNTDGAGIVSALERDADMTVKNACFIVCGTGPTSSAACAALLSSGVARIFVMSRRLESAVRFSARFADERLVPATYDQALLLMGEVTGIVDATSVGMQAGDKSVLPHAGFRSSHTVLDVVYAHGETDILAAARLAGAKTLDGLGMLIEQAALTVEIWARDQGEGLLEAPREVMRHAALQELSRREGE